MPHFPHQKKAIASPPHFLRSRLPPSTSTLHIPSTRTHYDHHFLRGDLLILRSPWFIDILSLYEVVNLIKSLGLYYIPHTRTPPIYLSLPQSIYNTIIHLFLQIIAPIRSNSLNHDLTFLGLTDSGPSPIWSHSSHYRVLLPEKPSNFFKK